MALLAFLRLNFSCMWSDKIAEKWRTVPLARRTVIEKQELSDLWLTFHSQQHLLHPTLSPANVFSMHKCSNSSNCWRSMIVILIKCNLWLRFRAALMGGSDKWPSKWCTTKHISTHSRYAIHWKCERASELRVWSHTRAAKQITSLVNNPNIGASWIIEWDSNEDTLLLLPLLQFVFASLHSSSSWWNQIRFNQINFDRKFREKKSYILTASINKSLIIIWWEEWAAALSTLDEECKSVCLHEKMKIDENAAAAETRSRQTATKSWRQQEISWWRNFIALLQFLLNFVRQFCLMRNCRWKKDFSCLGAEKKWNSTIVTGVIWTPEFFACVRRINTRLDWICVHIFINFMPNHQRHEVVLLIKVEKTNCSSRWLHGSREHPPACGAEMKKSAPADPQVVAQLSYDIGTTAI